MNNIGAVIKKYRLMNDLTQEELGKRMHVTKQAVSKWESGKTLPDIITIQKLSAILSVPNEEILGESVKQTKHYRKWVSILIPIVLISLIVMLFFAFDGFGAIRRRMQSGTAIVVLHENGAVVKAEDYQIIGPADLKPGLSGYSFDIDYGEVKGSIITSGSCVSAGSAISAGTEKAEPCALPFLPLFIFSDTPTTPGIRSRCPDRAHPSA